MRTRNLTSLALALLLLAIVPVFASSETAAQSGSFTLRLSDPKFSVAWDGETIEQDLDGLSVQLGGVRDASDPDLDNLLLSLMVLAGDDPALSAMLGLKGEQAYALVNGISGVLMMPLERGTGTADSGAVTLFGLSLADMERFLQIEGIRFTEGTPEPVQFSSSSGEYPRHSASLDGARLRELFPEVELPTDLRCDISYFSDGADNLRVEAALFGPGGAQCALGYTGAIASDANQTHTGTLHLETSGTEPAVYGEVRLRLVLSNSAEGKLPDISGLAPIDLLNLSEADRQRLADELQQLQLTMLGKLMTLPSLARIIAQAIGGDGFQLPSGLFGSGA